MKGHSERGSTVAGSGLYKAFAERSVFLNQTVRHAVIRHTARHAEIGGTGALMQIIEDAEQMELEAFLQRSRNIPMVIRDFGIRLPRRAEGIAKLIGINPPDVGSSFIPAHFNTVEMVREIVEI